MRRNCFNFQEKAFYQAARLVEMLIQCARVQAILFERDHCLSPHALDRIDEGGRVIAFVCQYCFARKAFNQDCSLLIFGSLAGAAGYPRHLRLSESWCSGLFATYPWPRRLALFLRHPTDEHRQCCHPPSVVSGQPLWQTSPSASTRHPYVTIGHRGCRRDANDHSYQADHAKGNRFGQPTIRLQQTAGYHGP